ncbi:Lipase [Porphyridium purpureum]|uniref:Lipase n=1 Tax=Porphyridium purpureum TaxID=35688 RepID=A0A5J4Z665_PORPP|nr:Lipase [Porphyridium purpureum]|eukprot:POR9185..scf295_1
MADIQQHKSADTPTVAANADTEAAENADHVQENGPPQSGFASVIIESMTQNGMTWCEQFMASSERMEAATGTDRRAASTAASAAAAIALTAPDSTDSHASDEYEEYEALHRDLTCNMEFMEALKDDAAICGTELEDLTDTDELFGEFAQRHSPGSSFSAGSESAIQLDINRTAHGKSHSGSMETLSFLSSTSSLALRKAAKAARQAVTSARIPSDGLASEASQENAAKAKDPSQFFPEGYHPHDAKVLVSYSNAAYCRVHVNSTLSECHCKRIDAAPDFVVITDIRNPKTQAHAYVGYSVQRMAFIVAFRGTANLRNWISNLQCTHDKVAFLEGKASDGALVHSGFACLYASVRDAIMDASVRFRNKLDGVLPFHQELAASWAEDPSKYNPFRILVTGHSLGGALATLFALDLKVSCGIDSEVYTFGQPRVGNKAFARFYNSEVPQTFRIINDWDVVPHLPLRKAGFHHCGQEIWYRTRAQDDSKKAGKNMSKTLIALPQPKAASGGGLFAQFQEIDLDSEIPFIGCAADNVNLTKLNVLDHRLYWSRLTGNRKLRGEKPPTERVYVDGVMVKCVSETITDLVTRRTDVVTLLFVLRASTAAGTTYPMSMSLRASPVFTWSSQARAPYALFFPRRTFDLCLNMPCVQRVWKPLASSSSIAKRRRSSPACEVCGYAHERGTLTKCRCMVQMNIFRVTLLSPALLWCSPHAHYFSSPLQPLSLAAPAALAIRLGA